MTAKIVLVVEDEFLVALDMQTILDDAGFEVMGPAASVEEALRLIVEARPDAALLDNNLNGQSAAPVALALKERSVPFAFVTGNDRGSLPAAFVGASVVRKPFDPRQLVDLARRLSR